MSNFTLGIRLAVIAAVAVGFSTPPAVGQYQVGDGRALENNPQVGSGGQNDPRVQNTAGQYGNALVTGNVGGLSSFHGDVGYGAPGEFRDALGSNEFYDFNRQSYGLDLGGSQTGDSTSNNWLRSVGTQSQPNYLMRAGSGSTLGEVSGERQPFGQSQPIGDYDQGAVGRYTTERAVAIRQQSELQYSQQKLGSVVDPQGRLLEINASPLTGLTMRPSNVGPQTVQQPQTQPSDSTTATSALQDPERFRSEPMPIALSIQLGEQLLPAQPGQSDAQTAQELSNAVNRMIGSTTAEPGADVYMDLLRKINESTPELNPPLNQLVPPPPTTTPGESQTPTEPSQQESAETEQTLAATAAKTMQEIIDKLDYTLPPLSTLAGQADKLLEESMLRGEQFMAAKRYFDAEAAYDSALSVRPGYPLAIVGKVHAQLGAGLYRSCAATLDALLSNHPELIAARYTYPLLPDDNRLTTIIAQLRHQLQTDPQAAGAALLLAYLGYQMDQAQWVQEGLDQMDRLMPDNALTPLLHPIWEQNPNR